LLEIGSVVSEEKISQKIYKGQRLEERQWRMSCDDKISHDLR